MQAARSSNLVNRMVRAAKLDPHLYEEVEADQGATAQAILVVVIASVATGIGAGVFGIGGFISGLISSLVGWAAWALVTYVVGTRVLAEPNTRADWGEVARGLAFAQSPRVLLVVGLIPGIGRVLGFFIVIWAMVAMVISLRQTLDYRSAWRALGVVVIGFLAYALVAVVVDIIVRTIFGTSMMGGAV